MWWLGFEFIVLVCAVSFLQKLYYIQIFLHLEYSFSYVIEYCYLFCISFVFGLPEGTKLLDEDLHNVLVTLQC